MMKRKMGILLSLMLMTLCAFAFADVEINEMTFPDVNFRTIVEDFDADSNRCLSDEEISAVTDIDCKDKSISNLEGIGYFSFLSSLDCCDNDLSSLDMSGNPKLFDLKCDRNKLTNLDVSKNANLQGLFCSDNQLTSLDVSQNLRLRRFFCQLNRLTTLNVTQNTDLAWLQCYGNLLTELDLGTHTGLKFFRCQDNQLSQINVSMISEINSLVKESDPADHGSYLDWIDRASLAEINREFTVDRNVRIITDESEIWYGNIGIKISEATFPDENFRSLVSSFDKNNNGYLSDEEIAAVKEIDCKEKEISTLQGLDNFTALEKLDCSFNNLSYLNTGANTALEKLDCSWNQLYALDISKNTSLKILHCTENELASLDVSENISLASIGCAYNMLTALDVSNNVALEGLSCNHNELTSLDVSNNKLLLALVCAENQLKELILGNHPDMLQLSCQINSLTSLDISKCPAIESLDCYSNQLTQLDVSKVPKLKIAVEGNEPKEESGTYCWGEDVDNDGWYEWYLRADKSVKVITGKKIDISKAKVTSIKAQIYTGKTIKPAVTIKYDGKKLTKGTDYTVSYKNNKKIGTATVIITGKGNYTGKKTVKFDIIPKSVKLSSLTAGKKQLTVKWTKGSNITGYEIQYCLKKDFKKAKTAAITKATTIKTVLKKLTAKKTYYVRIRTYKTVNGKKYYSAWSAIKSKKIK